MKTILGSQLVYYQYFFELSYWQSGKIVSGGSPRNECKACPSICGGDKTIHVHSTMIRVMHQLPLHAHVQWLSEIETLRETEEFLQLPSLYSPCFSSFRQCIPVFWLPVCSQLWTDTAGLHWYMAGQQPGLHVNLKSIQMYHWGVNKLRSQPV